MQLKLGMSIEIGTKQRFEQDLLQVQSIEGATESVFPLVEKLLFSHTDYQKAISRAVGKKRLDKYRSLVDAVLAESFLEYMAPTFRFYRGEGKQLRHSISEKTRCELEVALLRVIAKSLLVFELIRSSSAPAKVKSGGTCLCIQGPKELAWVRAQAA